MNTCNQKRAINNGFHMQSEFERQIKQEDIFKHSCLCYNA